MLTSSILAAAQALGTTPIRLRGRFDGGADVIIDTLPDAGVGMLATGLMGGLALVLTSAALCVAYESWRELSDLRAR